ncbi:hypothetical protein BC833DRAFT_574744 [Globomyces pollinis-pini]|nr:hypothetical protein BC833DRAFT_574744 [Globomyces pollinis-pini]
MSLNTESTEVTKTLIPVKNVSGRPWKTVQSHRTTGMIKNNNAKIGWKKRQAQLKNDLIFKQMKSELLTEQEQEKAVRVVN